MSQDYLFELKLKNGKHIIRLEKAGNEKRKFLYHSTYIIRENGVEFRLTQYYFFKHKLYCYTKIREIPIPVEEVRVDPNPSVEKMISQMGRKLMDQYMDLIQKKIQEAKETK